MQNMNLNSFNTKLRNLEKDLHKLVDEISIQNNASYLMEPLGALWKELDRSLLKIDVLYLSDNKSIEPLKIWCPTISESNFTVFQETGTVEFVTENVVFRIFDEDHFPIKNTDSLPTLVKLIISDRSDIDEEDLQYFTERFAKESILLMCHTDDEKTFSTVRSSAQPYTWKCTRQSSEDWEEQLAKLADSKDLIGMIAFTLSLKKISAAFDATIENEHKDMSARRISVQNDHMKIKKLGTQRVGQELFSTLKTNLQRSFAEFESGINTRFNNLTKNQPGSLYSFIMDEIDSLNALEEVKSSGETKYILPTKAIKELEKKAYDGFKDHLSHDVVSLNDYFKITVEEINGTFKENGLHDFHFTVNGISKSDVISSLEEEFHFDKQHESKSIKKGAMAFISAVRQPYMILIMTVGVLSYIPTLKDIRLKIWPLFILALGVGVFFALKSVKKQKSVDKTDELKRINQWLKTEYKRIFSNIEKEWKMHFFKNAKSEFGDILMKMEDDLKQFQLNRADSISEETNLTQRKIQTLEVFDKKLKESKRRKMQFESDLKSLNSDLKMTFKKLEIL